jgi:ABC-2 type transport system ATP-binding protein
VTDEILLIYQGQVLAEGNLYKIRELIDHHPHRIRVECDRPRELAAAVAAAEHVSQISYERDAITIETRDPDHAYDLIAEVSLERDLAIRSLTSPDNNLNAVFEYLTGGRP